MRKARKEESGYILLGVVVLMALGALIIASNLDLVSTNAGTVKSQIVRSQEFYRAEESLNYTASWLRTFSTSLASVFGRNSFYTKFDRSNPSVGSNDSSIFQIPTRIKMQGTSNSVILTKTTTLATSAFPPTVDTASGATFYPATAFQAASFGPDLVRVTLVDAIPVEPSKDYGDPDTGAQPPATDFNPIYRLDAMRSLDGGGHVFGYLIGSIVFNYGIGFFGKDYLEMNQPCDSYLSNAGAYGGTNVRANCTTGSEGEIRLKATEHLYGSMRTKGTIADYSPWDARVTPPNINVCANLTCTTAGQICSGGQCIVDGLPPYPANWTYYETNYGGANVNRVVASNAAYMPIAPGYYRQLDTSSGKGFALTSGTYYVKFFNLDNNSSGLQFNYNNGPINFYVNDIQGDKINGNQLINASSSTKGYMFRLHYIGTDAFTLNGNSAVIAMAVFSPYALVTVSGDAEYYGSIKAKALKFQGHGGVHYDESGDVTTVSDVSYKLRDVVGRYR